MANCCRHESLHHEEWDYGVDPDTGYHDISERWICGYCLEVFDAEELAAEMAAIEREREAVTR